jgi:hypothetical protein
MSSAIVEGKTVKVGDYVCFKSDYEQCGKIVAIKPANWGNGKVLVLENESGFGGDYLRYATRTEELASDCWVE